MDIVIYEDDYLTRNLLSEWLGEAGYRVHEAPPPGAHLPAPPDLVIASVRMPKQAGAGCLEAIRAAHPGAPLIAISGQFRAGLAAAGATALSLGARQVIAKPLNRSKLLEAVRDIIGTPA